MASALALSLAAAILMMITILTSEMAAASRVTPAVSSTDLAEILTSGLAVAKGEATKRDYKTEKCCMCCDWYVHRGESECVEICWYRDFDTSNCCVESNRPGCIETCKESTQVIEPLRSQAIPQFHN